MSDNLYKLELYGAEIEFGSPTQVEELKFNWIHVFIHLFDKNTNTYPSINIKLPLVCKNEWTIQEVYRASADAAQQLLMGFDIQPEQLIGLLQQTKPPEHPDPEAVQ